MDTGTQEDTPEAEMNRSAQSGRRRASKSRFVAILVGLALFASLAATIAVMSDLSPQPATVAPSSCF